MGCAHGRVAELPGPKIMLAIAKNTFHPEKRRGLHSFSARGDRIPSQAAGSCFTHAPHLLGRFPPGTMVRDCLARRNHVLLSRVFALLTSRPTRSSTDQLRGCRLRANTKTRFQSTDMHTHQPLPGTYVGVCVNYSANLSANVLLFLHAVNGSRVHGEIALCGDLGGGGPFHGTMIDSSLVFSTSIPSNQLHIEWKARVDGNYLAGSYECYCDHPQAVAEGFSYQQGEWQCQRIRGFEEINPSCQDTVWIFDSGESYGPLSIDDFVQALQSGHLPPCALLAFDDCTNFFSVAEFCEFLESNGNQTDSPQFDPPNRSFGGDVVREAGTVIGGRVLAGMALAVLDFFRE